MSDLKENVYKDLRNRIMFHDLAPGQILNEKELMEHYTIGRTPLRDILNELQRDGLIKRFPRSGTIVAPMDIHLFKEAIEVRMVLEGHAVQLAAKDAWCRRE